MDSNESSGWIVFLGVAIGIFSAVASNIGTNTQKYGFMTESTKDVRMRRPYQQQPLWWIGFILVVLGALGDLLSFSLAPQSLVAPTGSFTLVSNVFFARVWLGEVLTTRDIVGTVLVIAGAVISVSFGSHEETAYSIEELQALYLQPSMAAYGVFMILLWLGLVTVIRRSEAILRDSVAGVAAREEASPLAVRSSSPSGEGEALPTHRHKEMDTDAVYTAVAVDVPGPAAMSEPAAFDADGKQGPAETHVDAHGEDGSSPTAAVDEGSPKSGKGKHKPGHEPTASRQAVELAQLTAGLREPPDAYNAFARWHPLAYAAMAGSIGGQTVMFAKSLGEIVKATAAGTNQFVYFFTYVVLACMIACTVFEQHFLASSLQLFDALLVVPVFSSAFMLITVLGGAAYFGELEGFTTLSWVLFPTGIVLTVSGVLVLSFRKQTGDGMRQLEELGDVTPTATDEMGDDRITEIGGRGIELVSVTEVEDEDEEDDDDDDDDDDGKGQEADEDEEGGPATRHNSATMARPLAIEAGDDIDEVLAAAEALAVPRGAAEDGDASPSAVEVETGNAGPMMGDHHEQGKHAAVMQGAQLVPSETDESDKPAQDGDSHPTTAAEAAAPATTPRARSAAAMLASGGDGPRPQGLADASPPAPSPLHTLPQTPSPARSGAAGLAGIAGGSGGSRRTSLLRPDWQTVVASRPQGLAALLPFASGPVQRPPGLLATHSSAEHGPPAPEREARAGEGPPGTPEREPASRRPRASTDIPTSYGSAPDMLRRGAGGSRVRASLTPPSSSRSFAMEPGAGAGARPGHSARRSSILDSTLSLINAVTVSHTVVSAFGTGASRPRASTARSPRMARLHRASSANSRSGTPTADFEPMVTDSLPRSRSEAAGSPAMAQASPAAEADVEATSP